MTVKPNSAKSPHMCGICGRTRILVGYTNMNRPLLHCERCDRRPGQPKRRTHPSHR